MTLDEMIKKDKGYYYPLGHPNSTLKRLVERESGAKPIDLDILEEIFKNPNNFKD